MTTLKLGYSDPRTDAFGAHPVLGPALDLNDGQAFVLLAPDGLALPPPPRTLVPAGNIRTQGERGVRAVYRHSREMTVQLVLGPGASYAALVASVRTLLSWVNGPPALPVTLQYQPFGAASPVYLDVIGAACDLPADESDWLRLQLEPLELVFVCRPGLRGDRVTLSNLVMNPGLEQGSGPGVTVFSDTLANANAYAVQAGGALAASFTGFPDAVMADAPLHYYRLNETSGTSAGDGTSNALAATYTGGVTLNSAGLLTGDTDPAVVLNGTTGYVLVGNAVAAGMPTGNGAWSVEVLFSMPSTPGVLRSLFWLGNNSTNAGLQCYVDTSGKVNAAFIGTPALTGANALSNNATHRALVTWDGTTLSLYVDNSAVVTSTPGAANLAYGAGGVAIGANFISGSASQFWNGTIDEVSFYTTTLSSARASAHWTAATTTPTALPNTLRLPAGGRVAFGSPSWGPIQQWQLRFQYLPSQTFLNCYLHYTDAANYLTVEVGQGSLALKHVIAGVVNTLTIGVPSTKLSATSWYWLRITQFPAPPATTTPGGISDPTAIQASLYADSGGTVGAALVTGTPFPTADALTALAGRPQIAVSGAPVSLGGNFASVHTVALFGPGGWQCAGQVGAATGVSSGAWEQTASNTYPNGPVASAGAGRLDLAPAGTVDARWRLFAGGAPANTSAMPVGAPGDVVYAGVVVKSAGLGNGATVSLKYQEFDATGSFLRGGTLQSLAIAGGVQLAWPSGTGAGVWNLAGSWTTGASCAYADLQVEVADTVAGNSANGTLWLDNAQAWDATKTGTTTMPYCELRFAQSPAQLVVTGLLGDLPAPAQLQLGSYVSAWHAGGHLSLAVGRLGAYRPQAVGSALLGPSYGFFGTLLTPQATPVLDALGYGGFYVKAAVDSGSWQPRALSPRVGDALGTYHLLARYRTFDASPTAVQARVQAEISLDGWYSDTLSLGNVAIYYGPYVNPLASANLWTVADAGQLALPPFPGTALGDPSQLYAIGRAQWVASSGAAAEGDASWQCLLPVDGSLLLGTLNYPSNSAVASYTGYLWVYADGLLVNQGSASSGPALGYSLEAGAQPNAGHAAGSVGTLTTAALNVNGAADPYLVLDPTLGSWNGAGVNQAVGYVADEAGSVLPLLAEVVYSPLYLEAR